MNDLRFSVVVPVYNREGLVGQTIDSILSQTYIGFELIVVDDGSSDGTWDALKSYGDKIHLYKQNRCGPEAARFKGAKSARGEYVVFFDSDDILMPYALDAYDKVLRSFNDPPLLLGAMNKLQVFDKKDYEKKTAYDKAVAYCFRDYLSKDVETGISNSMMVIRKNKLLGILETARQVNTFPFDDIHISLLCGTMRPCVVIKEPHTVIYRIHSENTVRNVELMCKKFIPFVKNEWMGMYPGGVLRFWQRWSRIGGIAYQVAVNALRKKRYVLSLSVLFYSWPMICCAIVLRVRRLWVRYTPVIIDV